MICAFSYCHPRKKSILTVPSVPLSPTSPIQYVLESPCFLVPWPVSDF